MDPELRERVLEHSGRNLFHDDSKYDAEIDTSQGWRVRHDDDDDEDDERRRRTPSPPPRSPPPPPPPRPPPYHPQTQPDWANDGNGEDEFEPVELDLSRPKLTASDESWEEQLGRWVRRPPDAPPPSLEDNDSSDDEYVEGDAELTRRRRMAMQRYRSPRYTGQPRPTIDELLADPDVALQPRFYDLPLDLDREMRDVDDRLGCDAWTTFWRFCDRNWCFFCRYRRTTLSEEYSDVYRLMVDKMTRPVHDHDEEVVVAEIQNMYFTSVQPYLPPRTPCKRTGNARPPRYLWKSAIRRHMHEHMHRPVHDMVAMRNTLKRANGFLAGSIVKQHKKNPETETKVDLSRLKALRDNIDVIVRLGDRITKAAADFRL